MSLWGANDSANNVPKYGAELLSVGSGNASKQTKTLALYGNTTLSAYVNNQITALIYVSTDMIKNGNLSVPGGPGWYLKRTGIGGRAGRISYESIVSFTNHTAGQVWSSIDGSLVAPTGTAQYPSYFTSLNGITAYPARPAWKVAGVDYRVGINTGVSLKDPNTILPAVGDLNTAGTPKTLTIQANNVTLDGYDFTLGGWWRIQTNGKSNLIIRNCKLQSFCIWNNGTGGSLKMEYCEIDGLGALGDTSFGTLISYGSGSSEWYYNYFHDAQQDVIDVGMANFAAKYNLIDTIGYMSGAHADGVQFSGDGIVNNIKILFNTYAHTKATIAGPSSFIDCEPQLGANSSTMVMNGPEVAYNVASYTKSGQTIGSVFYRVGAILAGGTVNDAYVHENWADPTNMIGVLDERSNSGTYTKSGNRLLTGGTF